MNTKITPEDFQNQFQKKPEYIVSCGGRFEILGNHTDHNHGLCIASACNLEITAAVRKRKDKQVNLKSLGLLLALVFFAAQFVAIFKETNIGILIVVLLSDLLKV